MRLGDPRSRGKVFAPVCACALCLAAAPALAGAWTPEAGHGEVIVTTLFDQSNAGFNQVGQFTPTPKYRSLQASIYLDYGLADWLAATVKPSVQSSTLGAPDNQTFTGLGNSEIGVRGRVWRNDVSVISVQAQAQIPGTGGAANASLSGSQNVDFDFRFLGGKNFSIGALPAFVDVALGYRFRGGPPPNEVHADVSLGVYARPDLMVLAQSFNVVSGPSSSPSYPRWAQSKAQLSLVYALNENWRVQFGGFATLAGVNAYREYGALIGLWRRF
ncbi:hypothetical protein M2323_003357 [Rhodoblastus acidophilus]|uniref:hypothetical protein n=1 Tax=Rhodoblastus acidophilus TaxID=1074 RepID=UPI002224ABA4|nr:hypothetical protein [Rhodoblastus acidophilus]MCW2285500.1 hypothetical protein [Rhodoblastus acidophilus]MCW2334416.1 hypothetical protein [Rhodoblastus acidophilus]